MTEFEQGKSRRLRRVLSKRRLQVALAVLIAVLLAGAILFAYKYDQARKDVERLSDPQISAREQARLLVDQVGKLVQLPANETPTIATVSDVSKLQNQAFFAKAQNGDKVLIYTEARRAILYRPSTNKVIELAPINIGNSSNSNRQSDQDQE